MTPEIIERVNAWLRAQPNASPRVLSLVAEFVNDGLCCLEERARSNEHSQAIAYAHEAAARGCLLALVREAWGNPDVNACKTSDGRFWGARCPGFAGYMGTGDTEAEALVTALEAAP